MKYYITTTIVLLAFMFNATASWDPNSLTKSERNPYIEFKVVSKEESPGFANIKIMDDFELLFEGITNEKGEVKLFLKNSPYQNQPVTVYVEHPEYKMFSVGKITLEEGQVFTINLTKKERWE